MIEPLRSSPLDKPRRYQIKKCTTSSTETPRATVGVMIVPTSMTTPSQPMMPNTTTMGKTDGISRINPAERSQKTTRHHHGDREQVGEKIPGQAIEHLALGLVDHRHEPRVDGRHGRGPKSGGRGGVTRPSADIASCGGLLSGCGRPSFGATAASTGSTWSRMSFLNSP